MPPRRIEVSDESDDEGYAERARAQDKGKAKDAGYAWEATYTRSWDQVREDAGGSLQGAVDGLVARARRKRLLAPARAVRRTIVRHLFVLLDLSAAMRERDMRPTRLDLALNTARAFVAEWFDQNPLGQVGVGALRAGLGERVVGLTGNPADVLAALGEKHKLEPVGEPSLQNGLEMARGAMSHLPAHASKEVLIVYGALTTVDPGDITETLAACARDKIRISVVALAAEMKICRVLCDKTGGTFSVAMNEGHFKDLVFELVPPPAQQAAAASTPAPAAGGADLMLMGFPTRLPAATPPALCACHGQLRAAGFVCPRCGARLCDVPTDCAVCALVVVSAPHLARSFHHLFPVPAYKAMTSLADAAPNCHACAVALPTQPSQAPAAEGMSPFGRYRCPACANDFCAECDVFVHEVLHTCPGCDT